MSEFTLTMDASFKVKGNSPHARNWSKHIARDVDRKNGVEARHSNRRIVPERTHMNTTFVRSAGGSMDVCQDSMEIIQAMNRRLADVKKKRRKDAVLMRPLVLQLDPLWFDEHNPDWRENGLNEEAAKLHGDMIEWAQSRFGAENIVGGSLHMDEHTPGLQLAFVPVTEDGRLSQTDYFTGPISLANMHTEFREFMESRGYDVMHERSERSREHLSSDEFAHATFVAKRDRKALEDQRAAFNAEYIETMAQIEESQKQVDTDRQQLDVELAQLPSLRAAAKSEGRAEARVEARAEVEQLRDAAQEAHNAASEALRRAQATQEQAEADAAAQAASVALERARLAAEWSKLRDAAVELESLAGPDEGFDMAIRGAESMEPLSSMQKTGVRRARDGLAALRQKRRDGLSRVQQVIDAHLAEQELTVAPEAPVADVADQT